ncbi:GUN4 domain-containing protein [Nostoc sp. FACHB-280]|uniref:GUN4 domain-containing protein n=1 Tax=Nostoc sp. FACHB-280 TaxID=2692839 RepID=UPI00168BD63A|nr:GUN4 domain-containing protein [Nostoc sp. FACHB-280]MBD2494800.1 GUN4 domain-containing protein [Nostoc sp. FACHB-280]
MTQSPDNQPAWWESVQKILDNKLVGWGIPGIFVAIAADHAKNARWREFVIFLGITFVVALIIRIGSKLLPYFDKFLDWLLATQIPKWWTGITDKFGAEYLATITAECQEYQGRGFSGEGLDLENVFVPLGFNCEKPVYNPQDLTVDEETEIEQNPAFEQTEISRSITIQKEHEIGSLLRGITNKKSAWRKLVILGAPGSGKTTLLRHITLLFALRKQSKLYRGLPQLIPVLLRLRDVAPIIVADTNSSLAQVIAKAKKDESSKTQDWFNKQLKDGKCLVMLDGLDEIADDEHRKQVSIWVSQQLQSYNNKLPFILTSRPQAYNQAPLPNTPDYFVRSFTTEQRNEFVYKWYFNLEKRRNSGISEKQLRRNAESKKDELVRQINAVPSLRLMATNPLLLALIINTYKEKTSLAPTRIGLYKQVCDVLLQGRQSVSGTTRYPLKPEQKQEALQALALEMTKRQVLQFTLDEKSQDSNIFLAKDFLQQELAQMVEAGKEFTPEAFIEKDDLGVRELLSDRKQEKLYEFTHRTFQEYLTAVELTKAEHEPDVLEVFAKDKKYLDWWRQTILFYAGQVKIDKLIDAALNKPTVENLTLAYECLQNKLRVSREKEQELLDKVEQGLQSNDVEVFKLAASVQLQKRLNYLNEDCFLGSAETEDQPGVTITAAGEKIWTLQKVDDTDITEAEYRLFLLEQNNSNSGLTLENNLNQLDFVKSNAFCAWLSEKTRERFGEAGICYQRETSTNTFRLVRFRIPEKYHQLAYYLAAGMWKEADKETFKLMLKVAGQEKQGYLELDDIRNFPCEDLRIIDKLWVDYSNGRFGFSVQKEIYLSVGGILEGSRTSSPFNKVLAPFKSIYERLGGRVRDEDDKLYKAYCRFADAVGWRVKTQWIRSIDEVLYNTSAHKGHLPLYTLVYYAHKTYLGVSQTQTQNALLSSLASRLVNCNI